MNFKFSDVAKGFYHLVIWYFGKLIRLGSSKNGNGSILVIRNDALGDFVLSTGVLKFLREKYQEKKIVLLVEKVSYEMALTTSYADEVICFNKKKYRRSAIFKLRFLLSLRKYRFETVINPVYGRDRFSDEIALYARAAKVVGWDNPFAPNLTPKFKRRGDKVYTTLIRSNFPASVHQLFVNSRFIELFAGDASKYFVDGTKRGRSAYEMQGEIRVAMFMDAGFREREWESKKFELLTRRIIENFPTVKILLLGVRKEKIDSPMSSRVIDKRGATNVVQAVDLIKSSSLVIGNETGPLHISALLGIDTVCILGGGHYGEFFPYPSEFNRDGHIVCVGNEMPCYHCNWSCEYLPSSGKTYPCISTITVDQVFTAVSTKLMLLTRGAPSTHVHKL